MLASGPTIRFGMGDDVRASDEDREGAAGEIREHFAAGRLTEEELSERIQTVYAARTIGELRALLVDLPALPAGPVQQRADLAARRAHLQRRVVQQSGGSLVLFGVCTVTWFATGASGSFWPIWVLLVALIPLARNAWRLYGPAPELDRVEDQVARRDRHDERRQERRERQEERRQERRERRR